MRETAGEGTGLVYRLWEPSLPVASALLVHGLGAHSGRWDALAAHLFQRNISSCAIDLKGFGLTKCRRGHIDSFQTYFDDIRSLCRIIRSEHSGKKVFCVGESMGALILFLMAVSDPSFSDGLILVSPAFQTKFSLTPWDYIKVFWPLIYNRRKQFGLPLTSMFCTRDPKYQEMIDTDEREVRYVSSQLLTRIVLAQIAAFFSRKELVVPALFLLAGDDKITDAGAARRLFDRMRCPDKTLIEYPGMYHALSIDLGKEKVFEDISDWIIKKA